MDGQGLLHEVLTLGLVELDVLRLVELVEFLVAPAVLAGAAVAFGVGALTAGVDAQLVVGIRVDRPAGEVHVIVALGGALGHRVDVGRLVLQVDADVLHPRLQELRRTLLDRHVGIGEEAQLQLLAVLLADAAGSFLPAGVVEELLRTVDVESADDGVVGLECPVGVDGGDEARGRLRVVLHDLFAQGLGVDAGADGLADLLVLQRLVAGAEFLALRVCDARIDGDSVEAAAVAVVEFDVVRVLQCRELVGTEPGDEVDFAGADRLHLGVGVRVVAVLDLVELRLAAPKVRVRLERDRLVRFVALELEGARAHGFLVVLELAGLVDLRPHVLGHDGDLLAGVVRLRLLQGDLDGAVVGGLDLGEVFDEAAVGHRHLFILHHLVVGPGDVLGGQRFTIGPLHFRADRVGPDLALGVRVPFGGESLGDRAVLRVVGHKVLVHVPESVRRHEVEGGEWVEGVDESVGGDPQHVVGGRSRRGGGLRR